jgi:hypothetical protein
MILKIQFKSVTNYRIRLYQSYHKILRKSIINSIIKLLHPNLILGIKKLRNRQEIGVFFMPCGTLL